MDKRKICFIAGILIPGLVGVLSPEGWAKTKSNVQVERNKKSVKHLQSQEIQQLQVQQKDGLYLHVDISIERMLSLMGQQRDKYKSMDVKLASNSYKYINGKKELQFSREMIYRREGENVFSKLLVNNYQSNKSGYKRTRIVSIKSDQSRIFQMEENQRSPRVSLVKGRILENEIYFLSPSAAMWDFIWPWDRINVEESQVTWDEENNLYVLNLIMGNLKHGVLVILYVDPAKDFIPIRKERLKLDGTLLHIYENNDFRKTDVGLWFPYKYSWYDPRMKFKAEFTILELSVNKQIKDELFDFDVVEQRVWFETQKKRKNDGGSAKTNEQKADKRIFTIQIVDPCNNPISEAQLYKNFDVHVREWQSGFLTSSDKEGHVQLAEGLIFAFERERQRGVLLYAKTNDNLAGFLEITVQHMRKQVQWQLRPACKVHGGLESSALKKLNQPLEWTNVHLYRGKYRPLSCSPKEGEFEFLLPPGAYELYAYGTSTYSVRREIEIKAGQQELEVNFDLPADKLATLIGKPAPEFRKIKGWIIKGWTGRIKSWWGIELSLSKLRGKVVLLDFWGYWCGPCVQSMPKLMELHDKYSKRGLVIIGIHDDSVGSIKELKKKLKDIREERWGGRDIPFDVALDGGGNTEIEGTNRSASGATTAAYGIQAWPTMVLIDKYGKVLGRFHASNQDDIERLESMLNTEADAAEK